MVRLHGEAFDGTGPSPATMTTENDTGTSAGTTDDEPSDELRDEIGGHGAVESIEDAGDGVLVTLKEEFYDRENVHDDVIRRAVRIGWTVEGEGSSGRNAYIHLKPTLTHLRGDVLRNAVRTRHRECPDCGNLTDHLLFQQYPAVLTTGAWGKYLNPVYRCQGCETAHTLLVYETDQDAERPEWGAYPPEVDA